MKKFMYCCIGSLCFALAYHLGARMATAQAPGSAEIAVLTGALPNGGTIPLPVYADGTPALESECHWTVSPNRLTQGTSGAPHLEWCYADWRVVRVAWCVQENCGSSSDPYFGTANFMILALRNTTPTESRADSWGSLKARYRGERQPAASGK